jgi:hypothetical protein
MRLRAASAIAILVLAMASPGCSDDGGQASNTTSGLPRGARVVDLTPEQAAQFCDWLNQLQGGYHQHADCNGQPVSTDVDQASCVQAIPDLLFACPSLTVAAVEDCTVAQGPDLCNFNTVPACAQLRACAQAE